MKNIKTLDFRQKLYLISAMVLMYGSIQMFSCSMKSYCYTNGTIGQKIVHAAININSDKSGNSQWSKAGDGDIISISGEGRTPPPPPPRHSH